MRAIIIVSSALLAMAIVVAIALITPQRSAKVFMPDNIINLSPQVSPRPASPISPNLPSQASSPSPTQTPLVSGTTSTKIPKLPGQILDLTNWKLALPINTAHAGNPDQITQPELNTFVSAPFFQTADNLDGVVFRANAGGKTTKNSRYPRSELREMTSNGTREARWSNVKGSHVLEMEAAITHLPVKKPEVVLAQIHDDKDDIVMVRLEREHLFVQSQGKNIGDLDNNYKLGTVYKIKIVAEKGRIKVFYNDVEKANYAKKGSDFYFKAGCYTQSNTSKGDDTNAYGEAVIFSLIIKG